MLWGCDVATASCTSSAAAVLKTRVSSTGLWYTLDLALWNYLTTCYGTITELRCDFKFDRHAEHCKVGAYILFYTTGTARVYNLLARF